MKTAACLSPALETRHGVFRSERRWRISPAHGSIAPLHGRSSAAHARVHLSVLRRDRIFSHPKLKQRLIVAALPPATDDGNASLSSASGSSRAAMKRASE